MSKSPRQEALNLADEVRDDWFDQRLADAEFDRGQKDAKSKLSEPQNDSPDYMDGWNSVREV